MPDEDLLPLFLFDDEPVRGHDEDALQLKGFSRTIAAAAVGSPGPFTIGIFAGWGQGKTSILRQARSLIDRAPNQQHAVTAWVNAWRFEQEEHPIVPIILSILDGIHKKLKGSSPTRPEEKFLGNVHRALRAIVYGFGFKGKIAVPLLGEVEAEASVKDMLERYEKLAPTPDPLVEKSLYYHAYEILDGVLDDEAFKEPPFPKIVVFIDDLDRCLPDKALKVFESIKLVLSQRGFVFVLAVDRDVIDAFLTKRYRNEFGLGEEHHHGEQYMDKIIQLALHVPHHEGRFEDYIKNLIAAEGAAAPSLQGKLLQDEERKVFARLVKPLAAGTDRNPRSLIRILNRLLTDKFLWDQLPAEMKAGKPIQSADELLRFAAISRILENGLGIAHYRELVRSQEVCKGLAEFVLEFGKDRPFPSPKERPFVKDRTILPREHKIIGLIESSPSLREMLLSDDGKAWLAEKEKRQTVENFIDSTRREGTHTQTRKSQAIILNAVRDSLDLLEGTPISDSDLERVSDLALSFEAIGDLSPLANLPALEELYLIASDVGDLSTLAKLPKLRILDLTGVMTEDFLPLASLPAIEKLTLAHTSIPSLRPLSTLRTLRRLDMEGTLISDLSPLAKSTSLLELMIRDTQVSDLSPLADLQNMERLDISMTLVLNLSALAGLSALESLSLDGTAVSDLTPLAGLKHLKRLSAKNTPAATDQDQLTWLREQLPGCKIVV